MGASRERVNHSVGFFKQQGYISVERGHDPRDFVLMPFGGAGPLHAREVAVSLGMREMIIPAADLSEQISTAGKEASGTGNMKLALNGALTIGTLDGANVEIKEEVGDDNIFIFGLEVEDVHTLKSQGYNPHEYYNSNIDLKAAIDWLASDHFTPGDSYAFTALVDSLLRHGDPFLVLADYADYCAAQKRVGEAYKDKQAWARMAILNTARVGKFSSDRTIREYAEEIWDIKPC